MLFNISIFIVLFLALYGLYNIIDSVLIKLYDIAEENKRHEAVKHMRDVYRWGEELKYYARSEEK